VLAASLCAVAALAPLPALAQEVDPAAEEAFFVGVALLEAGDPSGAVAKFDQSLRIDKGLRRVHYYRARAWALLGDIAEARADADAYGAFPLTEPERTQLEDLRAEIDARAEQVGTAEPRPDRPNRPAVEDTTGPDGFSLLRAAEEQLARGECADAAAVAQEALAADNTLTRAFLVKGLALECLGEPERALTVIGMYQELRAGQPADPVALAARTRIEAGLAGESTGVSAPAEPTWRTPGSDARIEGVLGQPWGLPMAQALEVRTRRTWLPDVGPADVGRPRMSIGGSTARVERAWSGDDGLAWTRLRVFERSGIETAGWFVRSFADLYREVERTAGAPDQSHGLDGRPEEVSGAKGALKGARRIEVRWIDDDGDTILLRLGRCVVTGDASNVHPNNAPCLELVAWSGSWTRPQKDAEPATVAARRIEAPGRLQVDVSGGLGFGFGPAVWSLDTLGSATPAIGAEAGLDLNVRVAFGALVVGGGYALSIAGYNTGFSGGAVGPFADNRIMGYLGFRDRPRQRESLDVMVGLGLVPEVQGAAVAMSLRLLAQMRTADVGRFFVSFEPYIVAGTDISFVPIRLAIGGMFGTRQRPVRRR